MAVLVETVTSIEEEETIPEPEPDGEKTEDNHQAEAEGRNVVQLSLHLLMTIKVYHHFFIKNIEIFFTSDEGRVILLTA